MKEIDMSQLLMWKESLGRFRFQTTNSKLARQMRGRKTFNLTAYSTNENFWVFTVDLPSTNDALKRYKSLTKRKAKYDSKEEIYY